MHKGFSLNHVLEPFRKEAYRKLLKEKNIFYSVRLKISFSSKNPQVIPTNNSYYIASMIYRRIEKADPEMSLFLHRPYTFKFFTFSRLMAKERKIYGEYMEMKNPYFYFSSLNEKIAKDLMNGFIENPEMKIKNGKFILSEIKIIKEREINEKETFVTLSPISITTVKNRRIIDLYPTHEKFYENLKMNLIKKYKKFYGKEPENKEIRIEIIKAKAKRIKIKNTYHRCMEMIFRAEGSRELLEVGYQAGFGERNSMGFGMVKT